MNGKLKNLRKKIDKIDSEILRKLAERFSIISKIAGFKTKNKLPVFDGKREKAIMKSIKTSAKKLKLNEKMAEKIFKLILKTSRSQQKDAH